MDEAFRKVNKEVLLRDAINQTNSHTYVNSENKVAQLSSSDSDTSISQAS